MKSFNLAVILALTGCSIPPIEIDALMIQSVKDARRHFDAGNFVECYQLLMPVQGVANRTGGPYPGTRPLLDEGFRVVEQLVNDDRTLDAAYVRVCLSEEVPEQYRESVEKLTEVAGDLLQATLVGSNRALRPQVQRSTTAKVLLYLPDRILDLLDVISFDLHFGPGLFYNAHVTRAVQAGGGARAVGGIGLHPKRSLGGRFEAEASLSVLPVSAQALMGGAAGTSGIQVGQVSEGGLQTPRQPIYQDYRDYWAVGISSTFLVSGFDWEFHPLQLGDFLAGWVGIDFLHDDFSETRRLRLSLGERQRARRLMRVYASPAMLQAFAEHRRNGPFSDR